MNRFTYLIALTLCAVLINSVPARASSLQYAEIQQVVNSNPKSQNPIHLRLKNASQDSSFQSPASTSQESSARSSATASSNNTQDKVQNIQTTNAQQVASNETIAPCEAKENPELCGVSETICLDAGPINSNEICGLDEKIAEHPLFIEQAVAPTFVSAGTGIGFNPLWFLLAAPLALLFIPGGDGDDDENPNPPGQPLPPPTGDVPPGNPPPPDNPPPPPPPPPDVPPVPIPEPATLLLLGSGLAALGARARRRKFRTSQNDEIVDVNKEPEL